MRTIDRTADSLLYILSIFLCSAYMQSGHARLSHERTIKRGSCHYRRSGYASSLSNSIFSAHTYQFVNSKRLYLCNKSIHEETFSTIMIPRFTMKIRSNLHILRPRDYPKPEKFILLHGFLTFFLRVPHRSRYATRALVSRRRFFTRV